MTESEHDGPGLKGWRQTPYDLRTSDFDSCSNASHIREISIAQSSKVIKFLFTPVRSNDQIANRIRAIFKEHLYLLSIAIMDDLVICQDFGVVDHIVSLRLDEEDFAEPAALDGQ